jgi:hypothetical protein
MNKRTDMKIGFLLMFLFIVTVSVFALKTNAIEYDPGRDCLADSGLILYAVDWCSYCSAQRQILGDYISHISYIDCDLAVDCRDAGVQGYPTFGYEGKLYPGLKQLDELSKLTGCDLVQEDKPPTQPTQTEEYNFLSRLVGGSIALVILFIIFFKFTKSKKEDKEEEDTVVDAEFTEEESTTQEEDKNDKDN